jgi:hypothetical protein
MTVNWFFALLVVLTVNFAAQPARAFDCPNRFKAAQAAIDKATKGMKGMAKMMSKKDMTLVHALIDDAKMLLAGAIHNHEKPQGAYDHARSIAKAEAARGSAEAADIYHFKLMAKMKMKMKK